MSVIPALQRLRQEAHEFIGPQSEALSQKTTSHALLLTLAIPATPDGDWED
jgi:hypothetical protein